MNQLKRYILQSKIIKFITGVTIATTLIVQVPTLSYAATDSPVKIVINDVLYHYKNAPMIQNGRTYIPVREITESLGAQVWWNGNSQTVGISRPGNEVAFVIGSSIAQVNSVSMKMDRSFLSNGVTRVPLRFLSEALGMNVHWNHQARTVFISTANKQASNEFNDEKVITQRTVSTGTRIIYKKHYVQSGDTLWNLGIKYGVPMHELIELNGFSSTSQLSIGQTVQVPVRTIPVQATKSDNHGEYLDWWTEAQYLFSIGKVATVTDYESGISFQVKRTVGANHADCEPLTTKDTEIAKKVWGGFNWNTRSVLVEIDGRKIAASMSFMPHDIQYINNNNFNGHFDIHFKNSTRHKDGQLDTNHQAKVKVAAGQN